MPDPHPETSGGSVPAKGKRRWTIEDAAALLEDTAKRLRDEGYFLSGWDDENVHLTGKDGTAHLDSRYCYANQKGLEDMAVPLKVVVEKARR